MKRESLSEQQRIAEGAKLRAYLARNNLTQEDLAHEMDVGQGIISKWCRGLKPIAAPRLHWLGARLGFDPFEFRPGLVDEMGLPTELDANTKEQLARIISKMIQAVSLAGPHEVGRLEQLVSLVFGEPEDHPGRPPKHQGR